MTPCRVAKVNGSLLGRPTIKLETFILCNHQQKIVTLPSLRTDQDILRPNALAPVTTLTIQNVSLSEMLFQILQFTPCLTWLCLRNIPSGRSTPKGYLQMPFEFSRKWLLLMRQILLLPSQYRWYTPCSSVLRKRLRLSLWIIYWRKITLSRTFTKCRNYCPLTNFTLLQSTRYRWGLYSVCSAMQRIEHQEPVVIQRSQGLAVSQSCSLRTHVLRRLSSDNGCCM